MTPFEHFNQAIGSVRTTDQPGPTPKIVFICGTPRSGTTILCQSLAYCADVGYIDNLIARFATNPALGALLSQSLNLPKRFSGRSDFGQTWHLTEPHEFGLGWTHLMGGRSGVVQPDMATTLDPETAQRIEQLACTFGQPTLFKSFAYLWFIKALDQALAQAHWIHVTRDISATAQSLEKLYKARTDETGIPKWTSAVMQTTMETSGDLSLSERCFAQISDIDAYLRSTFATVGDDRKTHVALEDYVADPKAVTASIIRELDLTYDPAKMDDLT